MSPASNQASGSGLNCEHSLAIKGHVRANPNAGLACRNEGDQHTLAEQCFQNRETSGDAM